MDAMLARTVLRRSTSVLGAEVMRRRASRLAFFDYEPLWLMPPPT